MHLCSYLLRVTKRVNKFCFGAIYNGRLWEKELGVSALNAYVECPYIVLIYDCKVEFQAPVDKRV